MSKRSSNPSQQAGTSLLIDVHTTADLCGTSVRSVYRWVEKGVLPKPVRVNGNSRWRRTTINEWVALGCPRRTSRPRRLRSKKLPPASPDVQVDCS